MKTTSERFGITPDGEAVQLFSLTNSHGVKVKVTNYGAIITHILVPDCSGEFTDIVLGHDTLEGYLHRSRYFGALIGRFANRIANGKFVLNGVEYSLARNNGENHLHGGLKGFDKVVWNAEEISSGVRLTYLSRDGEEGYPGNLKAIVTYSLNEANELAVEYQAETDADTIVNLTNHSYFNLSGAETILDHELTIEADSFTPVGKGLIPTGEIRNVANTPMDFSSPKSIGACINDDDEQLRFVGGYDHNFVLRGSGLRRAARVHDPATGRVLEVSTTQPGMQFYSGNFLNGTLVGKGDRAYTKNCAFCLETQHFPDSPNRPSFPSTVLRPGEEFRQTTVFRFGVAETR